MHADLPSRPAGSDRQILIVEDDPDVRELLAGYLSAHGFTVQAADSGADARRILANTAVDAAVLDLNLPDEDGLDLINLISTRHQAALIIVSARASTVDRIVGLELGADDYLTKPFEPRELLARVRRVLKRTQPPEPPAEADYRFGGFHLDTRARRLLDATGSEIALTSGEYDLLLALLERPQTVLTRNDLMLRTHGRKASPFDRVIDVQVARLRKKLGGATSDEPEQLIRSVRNAGYLLTVPVQRG